MALDWGDAFTFAVYAAVHESMVRTLNEDDNVHLGFEAYIPALKNLILDEISDEYLTHEHMRVGAPPLCHECKEGGS